MLDLVLPDTDRLLLCSQIHARSSAPIIILSGTKRQRDRVMSLRLGADDFIAKPFDIPELVARVEAVMRRSVSKSMAPRAEATAPPAANGPGPMPDVAITGHGERPPTAAKTTEPCHVGELTIDPRRRLVTIGGAPLHLTPAETRLISALASEPERVFSRDELAEALWGPTTLGESRAVDVHIRRLRAKLEPFGSVAPPIVTVRGFGYTLGLPRLDPTT